MLVSLHSHRTLSPKEWPFRDSVQVASKSYLKTQEQTDTKQTRDHILLHLLSEYLPIYLSTQLSVIYSLLYSDQNHHHIAGGHEEYAARGLGYEVRPQPPGPSPPRVPDHHIATNHVPADETVEVSASETQYLH